VLTVVGRLEALEVTEGNVERKKVLEACVADLREELGR
jgi:hypothetical protein